MEVENLIKDLRSIPSIVKAKDSLEHVYINLLSAGEESKPIFTKMDSGVGKKI